MLNVHAAGKEPYIPASEVPSLSWKDMFLLLSIAVLDTLTVLVLSVPVILMGLIKFVIPPEKKNISGWTALVTGAGHGIGKAIAVELAKEGCNVAIADIDGEAAIEVANSLTIFNVRAVAYKIDVADRKSLKKLKNNIEKDIGPVDILVNNAGLMPLLSLREGDDEDVERIIAVNINSHLFLVRTFIDGMIKRKRGHIVTLSSMGSFHPFAGGIIYCATKYAVTGFSRTLEEELRQEGHGDYIKILSVHPYFVATRKDVMDSVYLRFPAATAELTGKATVDGILRNDRIVIVPWILSLFLPLVANLPYPIHTLCRDYIIREKESRRIKDPQNHVISKGGSS